VGPRGAIRGVRAAAAGGTRRLVPDEGSGFWSVSRYADIVAASRDVATFSSSRGVSFEEATDEDMAARRTIIDTDPPEHAKLRKIVASTFSRRAVALPGNQDPATPWPSPLVLRGLGGAWGGWVQEGA
jgi:cytochrome P450